MDSNDILKNNYERANHIFELNQIEQMEAKLQDKNLAFQKEQTDRFIDEYNKTNKRLEEINATLKAKIQQANKDAEEAKKQAKISKIIAIVDICLTSIISVVSILIACFK